MNINELLNELNNSEIDRVELVLIEGSGAVQVTGFSDVGSWRSYYNQPAIFMGEEHDKYGLIVLLEELTTKTYQGWKGGDYKYSNDQELVIEKCERADSGDGYINKVVEKDSCIQIICTKE